MSPSTPPEEHFSDRLVKAYERMLERTRTRIEQAEQDLPHIQDRVAEAREKAVELGELTREEAERISEYLKRDLHDAAQYMVDTGREMRDWWRFDLGLIEQRMLDVFTDVADRTRFELDQLVQRARAAGIRHTGEITAPGVLQCTACGKEMHFKRTGHIPPCPGCRGTEFRRLARE